MTKGHTLDYSNVATLLQQREINNIHVCKHRLNITGPKIAMTTEIRVVRKGHAGRGYNETINLLINTSLVFGSQAYRHFEHAHAKGML